MNKRKIQVYRSSPEDQPPAHSNAPIQPARSTNMDPTPHPTTSIPLDLTPQLGRPSSSPRYNRWSRRSTRIPASNTPRHTRSIQHSTRIPPRTRSNSTARPDRHLDSRGLSSVGAEEPAGTASVVPGAGRSTFAVAGVVDHHIAGCSRLGEGHSLRSMSA
jgi:hypothetical protein